MNGKQDIQQRYPPLANDVVNSQHSPPSPNQMQAKPMLISYTNPLPRVRVWGEGEGRGAQTNGKMTCLQRGQGSLVLGNGL